MQEIAVLASRALTAQQNFTAVADNVANVNTSGFRKLEMDFKEVKGSGGGTKGQPASYVADRQITFSTLPGSMTGTGNPLDVAIGGPGFFAVDFAGTTHYTRAGQFVINADGTLVTPTGEPVLDNANAQIQFPQGIRNITISSDGTISTEQGQLAQLGVYDFAKEDMPKLQRAGSTGFLAGGATPTPIETPSVRQGFVEASNVNAVEEMVNMNIVAKTYENSINLLGSLNDLESRTIRTLGGTQ